MSAIVQSWPQHKEAIKVGVSNINWMYHVKRIIFFHWRCLFQRRDVKLSSVEDASFPTCMAWNCVSCWQGRVPKCLHWGIKDKQHQEENMWLKEKVDHRLSSRCMFREKYTVGSTDQIPQPSFEKWTKMFLFISKFRASWDAVLVVGSVLELAADGARLRLRSAREWGGDDVKETPNT